jgi:hypothetical protein
MLPPLLFLLLLQHVETKWSDSGNMLTLSNGEVKLEVLVNATPSSQQPLLTFSALADGPLLQSFHGENATSGLYNQNNPAAAYRVLVFDHIISGKVGSNTSSYAEVILTTGSTPNPSPTPTPTPPTPARTAPEYVPLGNGDWNDECCDLDDGTKHIVASTAACEDLCSATAGCVVGLILNGTVRHGECWIASRKRAAVRLDFCGVKPGQSCSAFQRSGAPGPPPPAPPPPSPSPPFPPRTSSVLQAATVTIGLFANQSAFSINVTATLHVDGEPAAASGPVPDTPGAAWLEYLLAAFEWAGPERPQFVHTPHLKRVIEQHWHHAVSEDYVVGPDRVMGSPIISMEAGTSAGSAGVALVADTFQLNGAPVDAPDARPIDGKENVKWEAPGMVNGRYQNATFPVAFDLQTLPPVAPNASTVASFGFLDYMAEQHVYFRHLNDGSMVRRLPTTNTLGFGLTLLLQHGSGEKSGEAAPQKHHRSMRTLPGQNRRMYQSASQHLWNTAGIAELQKGRPQIMPFAEYAKVCYPAAMNNNGAFVDFKLPDGSDAGCLRTMQQGGVVFSKCHQSMWWNNMHMANGFSYWGGELQAAGNASLGATLAHAGALMLNFTLSAPAVANVPGLWESICTYNSATKSCDWTGSLHSIAAPHTPQCIGNPACDPGYTGAYWDFSSTWKSACSISKTSVMMVRVLSNTDSRSAAAARVLNKVQQHADWLVSVVASTNGSVPEWWVPANNFKTSAGWMDVNSHGGIHLQLLAELSVHLQGSAQGNSAAARYLEAARTIAAYLAAEILPSQKWADTETFYSCSNKPENSFDNFTGQPPRNTLSTGWAVDGFSALYEATGAADYLAAAEEVADYLSLYQASFNPTYFERPATAYVFGGMRSQNTDAEWLDARQTVDSEAFVRVGNHSGRQDLMERGVAALRASFALITSSRNQAINFPVANLPASSGRPFTPEWLEPENVDHEGIPQLPSRSGPDWGEVGGLAAAAYILQNFGGAYVDVARGLCVGIDGVFLNSCSFDAATKTVAFNSVNLLSDEKLPASPWPTSFSITLKVVGLPESLALAPSLRFTVVQNNQNTVGTFTAAELSDGVPLQISSNSADHAHADLKK